MSSAISTVSLNDYFMVGSAESGHDFVQNMYGMYIRFEQNIVSEETTNLSIAATAFEHIYKPLLMSSLGHMTPSDNIPASIIQSGIDSGDITNEQLFRITRDYKDVLVALWKGNFPNMGWKEFKESESGFPLITAFEEDCAKFTYAVEISYEELIDCPHRVFTALVECLLPRQDNPEHSRFGAAKRKVDQNVIDKVITLSGLRSRREGQEEELLSSVGIHKQFLSPAEIDEVNEFIANL